MSRCIDYAINSYIFNSADDLSDVPMYTDSQIEALNLVYFLSDFEMNQFVCTKLEDKYQICVYGVDEIIIHEQLSVAFCLACLASVGLDVSILRDLKFEYNMSKGLL